MAKCCTAELQTVNRSAESYTSMQHHRTPSCFKGGSSYPYDLIPWASAYTVFDSVRDQVLDTRCLMAPGCWAACFGVVEPPSHSCSRAVLVKPVPEATY